MKMMIKSSMMAVLLLVTSANVFGMIDRGPMHNPSSEKMVEMMKDAASSATSIIRATMNIKALFYSRPFYLETINKPEIYNPILTFLQEKYGNSKLDRIKIASYLDASLANRLHMEGK